MKFTVISVNHCDNKRYINVRLDDNSLLKFGICFKNVDERYLQELEGQSFTSLRSLESAVIKTLKGHIRSASTTYLVFELLLIFIQMIMKILQLIPLWLVLVVLKIHMFLSNSSSKSSGIALPPAQRINDFLMFICTKKTYDTVFSQLIDDMREEYYDALNDNKKWLARWRRIQVYPTIIFTIGALVSAKTLKKLVELWKLS